jgi:hypothetical protein
LDQGRFSSHRFGMSDQYPDQARKRYPEGEDKAMEGMALSGPHCSYFFGS